LIRRSFKAKGQVTTVRKEVHQNSLLLSQDFLPGTVQRRKELIKLVLKVQALITSQFRKTA
jgi:hypothetical protein